MGDGAMQVPGPAGRSFLGGSDCLPSALLLAQRRRPKGTGVLLCLPGRTGTRSMGSVITPVPGVVLRRAARVEVVLTVPGPRRCLVLVLVLMLLLMLMLDADADADVVVAVGGWVLPPGIGKGMGMGIASDLQARVTEQLEASTVMSTRNVSLTCLARDWVDVMYRIPRCPTLSACLVLHWMYSYLLSHTHTLIPTPALSAAKPLLPSPPPGSVIQARQAHMLADQGALPDRSRRFPSSPLHPRRLCVATHDGLGQWAVRFPGACLAESTWMERRVPDYLFPLPLHALSAPASRRILLRTSRRICPREEYSPNRIRDEPGGERMTGRTHCGTPASQRSQKPASRPDRRSIIAR